MRRTRPSRPPRISWMVLLVTLGFAGNVAAQAPASLARYFAPPGYRTKEFTLVRSDGWFHIFYIRENLIVGAPTERSLGHARSRDLYTWAEQDTILPVIEGTYEGSQIWAPHLLKVGGTWHLFYPAMRHQPELGYNLAQTMTEATSTNLFTWTRRETPLFDNSIFPWAYRDTTVNQGMDCRDPFVWWDDVRSEWLMYVSTRPASQPSTMVVGIAGSSDLISWSDRGFVPLTLPNVSFSDVAESPLILRRDATPLLFMWTTDAGQSLTYGSSNDAVTGWTNSRRLRSMLGYSTTTGWWAAETLVDGPRQYFATVQDTWINFWDLTWTTADQFRLNHPNPGQIFSAAFDRGEALPGDSARVEVASSNSLGRRVGLSYVRIRGAVSDTLVAADWGFPDSLTVDPDSAIVPLVIPPGLGDGRPCLLTVTPSGAGATGPIDTLAIGVREGGFDDPPPPPEPVVERLKPIWFPLQRQMQFTRRAAPEAWTVQVYDVRGRLKWSGRAGAGERTLTWSVTGAGGAAGVRPGIYFARMIAGQDRSLHIKFALLDPR